jgi:hypothetical protein
MTSLVLTERQGDERPDYRAHAQQLPGGLDVLVAPSGADSAMALDRELGLSSSDLVAGDCDLIVDCGRLIPGAIGQEKMIRVADGVLLLVRPDVAGVAHARWATNRMKELCPRTAAVLVVGSGDFAAAEVAQELEIDVLGSIPFDSRAALMACGAPGPVKAFRRSALVAFGRETVTALSGNTALIGHDESHGVVPTRRDLQGRHRILARLHPVWPASRPDGIPGQERTRAVST